MPVTGHRLESSSMVMSRRTCSGSRLDALDGECPNMDFLLAKTLFERFAITRPPIAIESVGDDFDHDHLVTFDVVFGALPQPRGGTARVRGDAAKRVRQLGAHLGKHVSGHVGSIAEMERQQNLDQMRGHGSASRSTSVDGRISAFTTFSISRSAASFSSREFDATQSHGMNNR